MTDDLTGGLDLLGDWLDAKGYGEEAGLCTRVMDHMHKQADAMLAMEAHIQRNEHHIHDLRLEVVAKNARIAELEVIAQYAGEDNARAEQYEARIRELEAALKQCDAALTAQSTYHQDDGQWMYLIDGDTANAAQAAARVAMEGKND